MGTFLFSTSDLNPAVPSAYFLKLYDLMSASVSSFHLAKPDPGTTLAWLLPRPRPPLSAANTTPLRLRPGSSEPSSGPTSSQSSKRTLRVVPKALAAVRTRSLSAAAYVSSAPRWRTLCCPILVRIRSRRRISSSGNIWRRKAGIRDRWGRKSIRREAQVVWIL